MIEVKHHFPSICYDIEELTKGVSKLTTWMGRIEKQSKQNPDYHDPDKYKGDAFEHLIEVLIKCSPIDKRINIVDYSPSEIDAKGIDGSGKSQDGELHTVQMKYRSNTQSLLTEGNDHIAMFPAFSKDAKYMTIFTTAKDLHYALDGFNGEVRTLGYQKIKKLVDGNIPFWKAYAQSLEDK